jgi:citronellol/citronellal dehydrogenase
MSGGPYRSVFRDGLLDGQVILVTGGGTGIGRCIAHEVAALGGMAVLAARRDEPLRITTAEIAEAGGNADWLTMSVRDETAVNAAVGTVLDRHGRLDGVVNNAGGQFLAPAESITPKGWRSVVDLNLTGTFLVTRAAFHAWFAEHGGAVVNLVADMWNGFPLMAHTGAARAAVTNLTRTLAIEWGPRGIRVNAVAPGIVYSSGMDTYPEEVQRAAAARAHQVPAGRIGTESEVSAAVVYLLSPAAAFVTGETVRVDGGASLSKPQIVEQGSGTPTPQFDGFHLARDVPSFWVGGGDGDAATD